MIRRKWKLIVFLMLYCFLASIMPAPWELGFGQPDIRFSMKYEDIPVGD